MKKLLPIILLCLLPGISLAKGYGGVEFESADNRFTDANSYSAALVSGLRADKGLQYSVKLNFSQTNFGVGLVTTNFEGRIKKTFDPVFLNLKPSIQVRLGNRFTSVKNFAYYAVDLGVAYPINKNIDLEYTHRYRNGFQGKDLYESTRHALELKVKATKQDSFGLRYSMNHGISKTDAVRITYTRNF
jgi:hypothetical protein